MTTTYDRSQLPTILEDEDETVTAYKRPVLWIRIPQVPAILEDEEETDTASIWPDETEDGCDFPCIICGDAVPNECSWHPFCSRGCFVETIYEPDDDCDY